MAYRVKKIVSNGYRCGCCQRDWEYDDWLEDRAKALSEVPVKHPKGNGDSELFGVEVIDGATGKVIACGELVYHGTRSSKYHNQVWRGHVDGVAFEEVKTENKGETWGDALARINKEIETARLVKARAELEAAQRRLDELIKK